MCICALLGTISEALKNSAEKRMFMKKEVKQWIPVCLAFLGTYGFGYLLKVMNVGRPYYTVIHLFVFFAVVLLLSWAKKGLDKVEDKKQRRRRAVYAFVFSLLF